jgi:hypothetical protein
VYHSTQPPILPLTTPLSTLTPATHPPTRKRTPAPRPLTRRDLLSKDGFIFGKGDVVAKPPLVVTIPTITVPAITIGKGFKKVVSVTGPSVTVTKNPGAYTAVSPKSCSHRGTHSGTVLRAGSDEVRDVFTKTYAA